MEIHDLKILLQQHFSDGLVTVVGSGLSCAEGLPGMSEIADHLLKNLAKSVAPEDVDLWAKLAPLIEKEGLEAALLALAPSGSLETLIVYHTAEFIASRERTIVSEVFSGARTLRFSLLVPHLLKPTGGLPVITTNYDRLLEIAAEEAGLGVDTMFVGQFAGELNETESRLSFLREVKLQGKSVNYRWRNRMNIFKPHGSLDWYHREGKPVRYAGDLPLPRLIITPGLNKFRNGYESPFDKNRERANAAIDKAVRFLIIGYGFNDDHLETHLTPRIRAGAHTLLLTKSLSEKATELAQTCPNVIAIQSAPPEGSTGSSIYIDGSEINFPDLNIWDLRTFISEVLEP